MRNQTVATAGRVSFTVNLDAHPYIRWTTGAYLLPMTGPVPRPVNP